MGHGVSPKREKRGIKGKAYSGLCIMSTTNVLNADLDGVHVGPFKEIG
jgi:hypothetical protein